ncbi:predicted protein [Sparassis crispa]|uniref:RNA helicase n=1 Tax=Sparassis crispa TaxID=139825 RepID=A0A401G6P1_9APHY|nr:predicted protein [Sparassis crispa]GBE77819.1 predicted protein [Sparassis crispa]
MLSTTSTAPTGVRLTSYRSFCSSTHSRASKSRHAYNVRPPRQDASALLVRYESPEAHPNETFEQIGVPRHISIALRKAFPSVTHPTQTQRELIPAILKGNDVFLKDHTGTGKSFGMLLALLSQRRKAPRDNHGFPITSLVVVPHRDLAYQLLDWMERIHAHLPEKDLAFLVQVLVRNSAISLGDQISRLRQLPPHILIGTPNALVDVLQEDSSALKLPTLSTVVVDEIDYLVESPPLHEDKYKALKIHRRIQKHPGPTRQILDQIYERPKETGPKHGWQPPIEESKQIMTYGMNRPQLVMSSATFRAHSAFLETAAAWLVGRRDRVVRVTGSPDITSETMKHEAAQTLGGKSVRHYVLIVSPEGDIANIEGAEEPCALAEAPNLEVNPRSDIDIDGSTASHSPPDSGLIMSESLEIEPINEFEDMPLPFNHNLLEAIAEAFALDVPRVALLVLPSSAPLKRVVNELRRFGVDARGLDVAGSETGGAYLMDGSAAGAAENPTLLVCTFASTRGLDLPTLSHVFILGAPEDISVESYADLYLHAAGRVGRFGRSGKVINVVEARYWDRKERKWKDQPERIRRVFKRIGIKATKYSHFD